MRKRIFLLMTLMLVATFVAPQTTGSKSSAMATGTTGRTKQGKIRNAMSAAPMGLAKGATIVDHPAKEGGEMAVLRKGTNEWTCIPDDPATPSNDPMCLDKDAMEWAKAWKTHADPKLSGTGIGYMLQGGGSPSNTDPFAKTPESGKQWLKEPPHLMMFGAKFDPKVLLQVC